MGLRCRLELRPTPIGIILTLVLPDGRKFGHDVCIIADGCQDLGRRWDMVCGHLVDASDLTPYSPMEMGRDYLSNVFSSGLAFLHATADACKWPGVDAGRLDAIKEARAWVAETMRDPNCEYPLVPGSLWSLPADGGLYFKAMEIEEKRYERCRQAIRLVVCDSEIVAGSIPAEKTPSVAAVVAPAVAATRETKSECTKRKVRELTEPYIAEDPDALLKELAARVPTNVCGTYQAKKYIRELADDGTIPRTWGTSVDPQRMLSSVRRAAASRRAKIVK